MSEKIQTLTIHGVELTQPDLAARYLPDGMTPMETSEALARIVAAGRCREGEEVVQVQLSGTVNRDASPVAVTFAAVYGHRVDERTWVDNRPETITITADEVATVRGWLGQRAGGLAEEPAPDAIGALVERMSEEELRAAARAGIVANAWLNMYPDELQDDHRDYADNAIRTALPEIVHEEETAFVDASDLDEQIAICNYWRSLMNYVPLDDEAREVVPEQEDQEEDEEDLVIVTVTFPDGSTKTSDILERHVALHKARNTAAHLGAEPETAASVYIALDTGGEAHAGGYHYKFHTPGEVDRGEAEADRGE